MEMQFFFSDIVYLAQLNIGSTREGLQAVQGTVGSQAVWTVNGVNIQWLYCAYKKGETHGKHQMLGSHSCTLQHLFPGGYWHAYSKREWHASLLGV